LRDDARQIAKKLNLNKEYSIFQKNDWRHSRESIRNKINFRTSSSPALKKWPYDAARIGIIRELFSVLQKRNISPIHPEKNSSVKAWHHLLFF